MVSLLELDGTKAISGFLPKKALLAPKIVCPYLYGGIIEISMGNLSQGLRKNYSLKSSDSVHFVISTAMNVSHTGCRYLNYHDIKI